jgi:hypothetical protein
LESQKRGFLGNFKGLRIGVFWKRFRVRKYLGQRVVKGLRIGVL